MHERKPQDVHAPAQDVISNVRQRGQRNSPGGTASPHTGHGFGTLRGNALASPFSGAPGMPAPLLVSAITSLQTP